MNGLHVALLILALLILVAAAGTAASAQPISRYGVALIALGLAVYLLDLVLVAARVYG